MRIKQERQCRRGESGVSSPEFGASRQFAVGSRQVLSGVIDQNKGLFIIPPDSYPDGAGCTNKRMIERGWTKDE